MHHPSTLQQGLKRNSKVCLAACCATNAQLILPKRGTMSLKFSKDALVSHDMFFFHFVQNALGETHKRFQQMNK